MSRTLRRAVPDGLALLLLVVLWMVFFWRLFTPVTADQASLKLGDFSGQFVSFGGYQASRMCAGEWPLWNPYNNGGLPFAADTQAAVFYPPRWITIAATCSTGWSYHALELEMTAHVLFASMAMYALGRRLTLRSAVTVPAALAASVIFAYGGYLSGYPPLQLAVLEAGVWLPLGVLAITEATRWHGPQWRWILVGAMALGLSWLAGHPQTSYFLSLLMAGYLVYRAWTRRWRWAQILAALAVLAGLTGLLASAQLLPGLEYLPRTARPELGFDAKGNGFPFQDALQMVVPGVLSVFSPLYAGLLALVLASVAVWRRAADAWFWGGVALLAFAWSLGANSPVYPLLYQALPGLQFFRGQERAAFIVAGSLAILASLGLEILPDLTNTHAARALRRALWVLAGIGAVLVAFVFTGWMGNADAYATSLPAVVFSLLLLLLIAVLLPWLIARPRSRWLYMLLPAVLAFDLYTVNMDAESTYDRVPPGEQIAANPETVDGLAPILADDAAFRVDGARGLTDNYGSLWSIADIRGISPLFLSNVHDLLEGGLSSERVWELMAVRYVLTDWQELPVPSSIVDEGTDRYGPFYTHALSDPRPFALLAKDFRVASSQDELRTLLNDPVVDLRSTVLLQNELDLAGPLGSGSAAVTRFAPETIELQVSADAPALLSVALLDYPGWTATVDNVPARILRAYGAFSAVTVPAGHHAVVFRFQPVSVSTGVAVSGVAWAVTLFITVMAFLWNWRRHG